MDVGRRRLFQLLGAVTLGTVATTVTKVLPKRPIKPFVAGEHLTAGRLNELLERVNNG